MILKDNFLQMKLDHNKNKSNSKSGDFDNQEELSAITSKSYRDKSKKKKWNEGITSHNLRGMKKI